MASTLLSGEFLSLVATWAEIFVVVFATLGALSGVTYVLVSRPLRKFGVAGRAVFEAQVATARLEAERAIAEAQQASERAALANERAARASERASENEKEAARLRKIAEDERLARLRLVKRIAPRRLTGEQRETLAKLLRPISGGSLAIVSPMSDAEASDFADDFNSAIQTGANWNTLRIPAHVEVKTFGVFIGMVGVSSSARITLLSHALDAIGVAYEIVASGTDGLATISPPVQQRTLFLIVAHKPQRLAEME